MKRAAVVLLVLGLLAAGCGEGIGEEETTASTTLPPASTTLPPASTTTSLAAPSTTGPEPTTTTVLPSWAGPGFPEARPPEEIPWDEVGAGWLLVRFGEMSGELGETAGREALFMIDPDDVAYAVSGWDGSQVMDWSADGSRALVFDGALTVIDLRDGGESAVPADLPTGGDYRIDARFLPAGEGIVVRTLVPDDHVRLETLGADGAPLATLAEFDFPAHQYGDPEYVEMGVTWLFTPGGDEVVVATGEGISLLDDSGGVVRLLDTTGLGCTLSRWWDTGSVLAACYDRDWAASPCWYRGPIPDGRSLWAVPLDGSSAMRLTPQPVCTADVPEFSATYEDGLPLGSAVAARTGSCCECGGGLDLITGSTVTPWAGYPESPTCSPRLVAARPDRVLVLDTLHGWDAAQGATGMLGAILEVAADGTTLGAVVPVELGRYGGVQQALTTEETAG